LLLLLLLLLLWLIATGSAPASTAVPPSSSSSAVSTIVEAAVAAISAIASVAAIPSVGAVTPIVSVALLRILSAAAATTAALLHLSGAIVAAVGSDVGARVLAGVWPASSAPAIAAVSLRGWSGRGLGRRGVSLLSRRRLDLDGGSAFGGFASSATKGWSLVRPARLRRSRSLEILAIRIVRDLIARWSGRTLTTSATRGASTFVHATVWDKR
jgi:hypothetical protein